MIFVDLPAAVRRCRDSSCAFTQVSKGSIWQNCSTISQAGYGLWCKQDTASLHQPWDPSSFWVYPHQSPPWPRASTNLVSISIISSVQECYTNAVMSYINFGTWLFFFSPTEQSRDLYTWVTGSIDSSFFFFFTALGSMVGCIMTCLTIRLVKDLCVGSSLGNITTKSAIKLCVEFFCVTICFCLPGMNAQKCNHWVIW